MSKKYFPIDTSYLETADAEATNKYNEGYLEGIMNSSRITISVKSIEIGKKWERKRPSKYEKRE